MSNAGHFSHRNSDYIYDVTMDIASSFFPPPIVLLPSNDTLPPIKNYEYDFKIEKEMVLKYDEEQLRIKELRVKEEKLNQREPVTPPSTSCSPPPSSSSSASTSTASSELQRICTGPQTVPMIPLIPATKLTPLVPVINPSKTSDSKAQPTNEIRKLHGFEEFEVASSVFDELELRSLDDRTELAKLRL